MRKYFSNLVDLLRALGGDRSGASAAEYALILAIVTTGIAGATITLGNVISTAIDDASGCIASVNSGEVDCGEDAGTGGDTGGTL